MFGSLNKNPLRGPGRNNWDLAVSRNFKLPWWSKEGSNLQFRAESFNFTNTPHFLAPSANVSSGNFLTITSANQDQRQFRLGLRLSF